MGILDSIIPGRKRLDFLAAPVDLGIASPWQDGELSQIVPSEIVGEAITLPMTRGEAMTIPAVAKARNLICSTLGRFPLVALDNTDTRVDPQPTFLYRTDSGQTPYARTVMTADDLMFYGTSLWIVKRGAAGQITNAEWLPRKDWTVTRGHVMVDEKPLPEDSFILFHIPGYAGLLNLAARTLRGARDTEQAWVSRMKNPIPLVEFKVTSEDMQQDEADAYVDAWGKRHRSSDPSVGLTPAGAELVTHGDVSADLFIEGRNALRTDIGSFVNVNVAMLDGTIGVDSLTYSTKDGEKNTFYEFSLPFWTDAFEAALSGDDVVPRGQRVRFDKYETQNLPTPTGPNVED